MIEEGSSSLSSSLSSGAVSGAVNTATYGMPHPDENISHPQTQRPNYNNSNKSNVNKNTRRTLYLSGITEDVTPTMIFDVIRGGPIESLRILSDKGCAFLEFTEPSGAFSFFGRHLRASHSAGGMNNNGTRLQLRNGHEIRIGWARGMAGGDGNKVSPNALAIRSGATRNILINPFPLPAGLDPDEVVGTSDDNKDENSSKKVGEETLRKLCEPYGHVDTIRIISDRKSAYIHYCSIQEAMRAVAALSALPGWSAAGVKVSFGRDRCAPSPKSIANYNTMHGINPPQSNMSTNSIPYTVNQQPNQNMQPGFHGHFHPNSSNPYAPMPNYFSPNPANYIQQQPFNTTQYNNYSQPGNPSGYSNPPGPQSQIIGPNEPYIQMNTPGYNQSISHQPPYHFTPPNSSSNPDYSQQQQLPSHFNQPPPSQFHPQQSQSNQQSQQPSQPENAGNIQPRAIYIGNVAQEATCEDLCNVVKAGALERVRIIPSDPNRGSRALTAAFLTFIEHEGAAAFMRYFETASSGPMGGLWVRGVRLRCSWANPGSTGHRISGAVISALRKGASRTVYVARNVPQESSKTKTSMEEKTSENQEKGSNKNTPQFPPIAGGKSEIRAIFSKYGEIESVALLPSGRIAFVNFCQILDAVKAVEDQAQIIPLLSGPSCEPFFPLSYGRDRCAQPPPF